MAKLLFLIIFILDFSITPFLFSQEPNSSWLTDITNETGVNNAKGGRVSLVDINNDDYPDLVWGLGGINKNDLHIMLNVPNPDQNSEIKRIFIDWTDSSGINQSRKLDTNKHTADIAAFVDLNNDGNVDVITSIYYHRLQMYEGANDPGDRSEVYLGDGKGHFTLMEENGIYQLGLMNTTGLGLLDFDLDGILDLFMGQWFYDYAIDRKQNSYLLKGSGDGSFTRYTSEAIDENNEPLYGTNVTDCDNDGYQEIVTSPYCRSGGSLYKTDGSGTFWDVAAAANYTSQLIGGDHGQNLCQWESQPADFDCDGDIDLLQVQVHGGYNTGEGRTHISVNQGREANYRYEWELDRLKRDAPTESHLGDQGGQWMDIDGDGWLDIAICQMAYPSANLQGQERIYLLRQNAEHYFEDISKAIGVYNMKEAHSIEPADFDLDGDQDIFFSRQHRDTIIVDTLIDGKITKDTSMLVYMQISLLRNNIGNTHNWVSVKLEPPAGHNQGGIGTRITVFADGHNQIRDIEAGLGHFSGQQPFIQNISLGDRNRIDSLQVRWQLPGFPITTIYNPPINLIHKINNNGLDGYLKPWDDAKPLIAVNSPYIDLRQVQAGETGEKSVQISNIGDDAMIISSIELDDDMDGQLALTSLTFPLTIQPNESISLNVQYTPVIRDTIYSHIIINSNSHNAPRKLIDIEGNGLKEEAIFGISAAKVLFDSTLVDSVYTETLWIRNDGELPLLIEDISITGFNSSAFEINNYDTTIQTKDSIAVILEFKPLEMRTYNANIEIQTNAYNIKHFTVPVTGICNGPTQELYVKSLILMGSVEVGKMGSTIVQMTNLGVGNLIISEVYPEENLDNAFKIIPSNFPIIIPSGQSDSIEIQFSPAKAQSYKTKLIIESNSIKDPEKSLTLNATGVPVGIADYTFEQVELSPNPASDFINVDLSNFTFHSEGEGLSIRIINVMGNEIHPARLASHSTSQEVNLIKIDVSTLPPGVYFLWIEDKVQKFMIVR